MDQHEWHKQMTAHISLREVTAIHPGLRSVVVAGSDFHSGGDG